MATTCNLPMTELPETPRSLQSILCAPCLGLAWVLANVVLGWLGLAIGHMCACLVTAGALDGALLAVIVVTRASDTFQGAIAGAFGGLGLDNLGNSGQSLVTNTAHTIHGIVDTLVTGIGGPGHERVHAALEQATVQGIWTAILVVLAALIAKWLQDSTRLAMPVGSVCRRQRSAKGAHHSNH